MHKLERRLLFYKEKTEDLLKKKLLEFQKKEDEVKASKVTESVALNTEVKADSSVNAKRSWDTLIYITYLWILLFIFLWVD